MSLLSNWLIKRKTSNHSLKFSSVDKRANETNSDMLEKKINSSLHAIAIATKNNLSTISTG